MSRIIAIAGWAALAIAAMLYNTQPAQAGGGSDPCSGVDCGECSEDDEYCDNDEDCGCVKEVIV